MKLLTKLASLFLLFGCGLVAADNLPVTTILISETIDHPALNNTIMGIRSALVKNGYGQFTNMNYKVESAQGSNALAAQIASKFSSSKANIVVGVGTLSAQSLSKYAVEGKVKLVFASVTDPLAAKLVQSLEAPGNNTTGVSNYISAEPQLTLFLKIQPNLKRLGIIYNPGELNSVSIIKELDELCAKFGLTLTKQTVNKTADVAQAATKIAAECDAIFISNDNTTLSAMKSVIKAANANKIPVYVSDTYVITSGALAALGPNQAQVGEQAGEMIVKILNGADISTIPVQFPDSFEIAVNLDAAKLLGITIPADVISSASHVYQNGSL